MAYLIVSEHETASLENDIKGLSGTPPCRARRGSSLVEMLIAIFVLAIVLISMIGMFLISRSAVYSKEDETANSLVLRLLEELESRPYSDFLASAAPFDLMTYSGQKPYKATVRVLRSDKYSSTVSVEITWDGVVSGLNKIGNVTLERVISAGGHKNVGERH